MNFRDISLILKREYLMRLRSPGFIAGCVLGALSIVALAFLPSLLALLDKQSATKVAVVDPHNLIYPYLPVQTGPTPTPAPTSTTPTPLPVLSGIIFSKADTSDETALSQSITAGKIDAYIVVNGDTASAASFSYHSKDRPNATIAAELSALLTSAATQAKMSELGITPQQAVALFSTPKVVVEPIAGGTLKNEKLISQSIVLVYFLLIILYVVIIVYGIQVAMGVVEEKSSRVMEILVTAVKPLDLMLGKVLGLGLAGLTQAGLVTVVGLGLLLLSSPLGNTLSGLGIDISLVPAPTLLAFLVFFILGYLLYAALYGGLGSLVSRTEDVNGITGPITMVMVGVYLISLSALGNPDADYVRWLSFFPFFTPMLMFIRVALSSPSLLEVLLSIVILLASILIFAWIAARIYRLGVLMYGKRPSFREVVRLLRTS